MIRGAATFPTLTFFIVSCGRSPFQRREFLRGNLVAAFKGRLEKSAVNPLLEQLDIWPETRSAEFSVDRMLALCKAFRAKPGNDAFL
jgi:hypothetical protein